MTNTTPSGAGNQGSSAASVYFEVVHDDGDAFEVVTREEYDRLREALMLLASDSFAGSRSHAIAVAALGLSETA